MNDLSRTVLDLVDHVDEATMASPTAIRARGDQRRRRTALAGLAAAAVVLAAGAVLTVTTGPPNSVLPAGPIDSDHPEPSIIDTKLSLPSTQLVETSATAARGSRFVVVGSVVDRQDDSRAAIWWSDGGQRWTRTGPTSGAIVDVVPTSDGFVAVGSGPDGPRALYSSDGQQWTEASIEGRQSGRLTMVETTSLGLFAWEDNRGRGQLWRSSDGRAWSEVTLAGKVPTVCQAEDTDEGVALLGAARKDGRYLAARWTSSDGGQWSSPTINGPDAGLNCFSYGPGTFHTYAVTDAGTLTLSAPGAKTDLEFHRP